MSSHRIWRATGRSLVALFGLALSSASVFALPPDTDPAYVDVKPVTVPVKPIRETVAQIMARENNRWAQYWNGVARVVKRTEKEGPDRSNLPQNPNALPGDRFPFSGGDTDGPVNDASAGAWSPGGPNRGGGPFLPQSVGTSFLGGNVGASGFLPPDTMMDVGPTQIVMALNGRIRVFNKNGALGPLDTSTDTFFSAVRGASGTSDPRVKYDRLTQRWFIVMINVSTPNRILIAVSSGPTITSSASFSFYQFTQDAILPSAPDTGGLFDYPSLGVDQNGLYIGGNVFNGTLTAFIGSTVFVVNKANLLAGTLTVSAFRNVATATVEGPFAPFGVSNDDTASNQGYFVGVSSTVFSRLILRRITWTAGVPSISTNIQLNVPVTSNPVAVPQLGSAATLDGLDDRLMDAGIVRDRSNNRRYIWTAHQINNGGRNAMRYYAIDVSGATPTLQESGTFSSPSLHYWMGSVTATGQGHVSIASSASASTQFVGIVAAGRLNTDAAGTLQAPTTVISGVTSYAPQGNMVNRWGDYSQASVDPNDDQTVWMAQEYVDGPNSWAVRIFQLRAPGPAPVTSLGPNTLRQGSSNVNVVVTGNTSTGAQFYDTDASYPNRLLAAFSGTGVTVNSVTYNAIGQMTVNVSVAGTATTGLRNLTVTNPDGQTTTGTNVLNVTPLPSVNKVAFVPTYGKSGLTLTGYVQFATTDPAATNVTLTTTNGALFPVPATVTMPPNGSVVPFSVTVGTVPSSTSVTVTATTGNGVVVNTVVNLVP